MTDKDPDAYRTISEVSEALHVPPHVLRFWETKFPQVKPLKRGGGRRFYRRADVDLLRAIRWLLYEDAYTIRGVQRLLRSKGAAAVAALDPAATSLPERADEAGPEADGSQMPRDPSEPRTARALFEQLAIDIADCQAILRTARRAPSKEPGDGPIPPPPAAATDPGVPASAVPPP